MRFILVIIVSMICLSRQQSNNNTYNYYHTGIHLLSADNPSCTDFVFPGKSLCNFVLKEQIEVDIANTTDGQLTFSTEYAVYGDNTIDYVFLNVTNVNKYNYTIKQACDFIEETVTFFFFLFDLFQQQDVNDVKSKRIKITSCSYRFNNPQVFIIFSKIIGGVKAQNDNRNRFVVYLK